MYSLEILLAFLPSSPPPAPEIRAQIPSFSGLLQMYKQISALSVLLCCLMLGSTYRSVPAGLDFEVAEGEVSFLSAHWHHFTCAPPSDGHGYVLFANLTIHQTATV